MNNNNLFNNPEQEKEFEKFCGMNPSERKEFAQNKLEEFKAMDKEEQDIYMSVQKKGFDKVIEFAKKECKELTLSAQLGDVSRYVSLAQISSDYFGKTKQWLYQRIKGYNVNGKPAKFTDEEKETFRNALMDISNKMKETAMNI